MPLQNSQKLKEQLLYFKDCKYFFYTGFPSVGTFDTLRRILSKTQHSCFHSQNTKSINMVHFYFGLCQPCPSTVTLVGPCPQVKSMGLKSLTVLLAPSLGPQLRLARSHRSQRQKENSITPTLSLIKTLLLCSSYIFLHSFLNNALSYLS